MNTSVKVVIVAALVVTVMAVVAQKQGKGQRATSLPAQIVVGQSSGLPRLVDLGAGKCIPCKQMAPILEDLKKEYAGRMEVEFIDVWKSPDAGKAYGVELIPTQIFYDAGGKELFRHVGFFGREDILTKWKELGVDLGAPKPKVERPDGGV